ncbi:hypothetical protein [Paenisporosarcina sp. TG-14]|uniref:hypothetical protein n=1 Tax=Paenisporosarcina sp. TG-14 TaxID=1231057 RepID=UPI0002D4A326|nr:hypothetical protein [Paenisporosarcina sp. TG-14]
MEVIIFGIIVFIISAITKRKNPNAGGGTPDPSMSKPVDQRSTTKIEDYAREVYADMQRQLSDNQPSTQSKPDVEYQMEKRQTAPSPSKQIDKQRATRRPGRLSAHQTVDHVSVKTADPYFLVPTKKSDMLQAIVFSEILSPPKSKR